MKPYKYITVGGTQMRLHRHIMEKHLNKKLNSSDLVHHVDGDVHNNHLDNLRVVTRAKHAQIHNPGCTTRFKTQYIINKDDLIRLCVEEKLPVWKVANIIGASCDSVFRALKKYNIKRHVFCYMCGNKAKYIHKELCNKCYHKEYYAKHKRV